MNTMDELLRNYRKGLLTWNDVADVIFQAFDSAWPTVIVENQEAAIQAAITFIDTLTVAATQTPTRIDI